MAPQPAAGTAVKHKKQSQSHIKDSKRKKGKCKPKTRSLLLSSSAWCDKESGLHVTSSSRHAAANVSSHLATAVDTSLVLQLQSTALQNARHFLDKDHHSANTIVSNPVYYQLVAFLKPDMSNAYFIPSTDHLDDQTGDVLEQTCRLDELKGVKYFLRGYGLTKEELESKECKKWKGMYVGMMKKERKKLSKKGDKVRLSGKVVSKEERNRGMFAGGAHGGAVSKENNDGGEGLVDEEDEMMEEDIWSEDEDDEMGDVML